MKNFAKTVSRFLLCERLSDWAKLGLRVFIGFMMLTHGIAKIEQFDTLKSTFPATMGMSSKLSLILIILVEVGCSSLVLLGFMTRLAVLPLMFSMIIAAFFTFSPISLSTAELPMLYLGIYTFILLAGPQRSSKKPNLIILLHIISGLGVNPSFTVRKAYSITWSQYSLWRDTTSNGSPYLRAI